MVTPALCDTGVFYSTGSVPKEIKSSIRQMLVETGPLVQSRFLPEWKKKYPETLFDTASWGFQRLTDALESMPDLIVITRDGAKKSFVSLKGGTAPPVSGGESGKGGGAMSRDAMSGVLAGVIQSKVGNVDPAQVQAFVKQPKLQFTIDCLVEEFAKFSSGARPGLAPWLAPASPLLHFLGESCGMFRSDA